MSSEDKSKKEKRDESLKRWISAEITSQLRELKEQINKEMTEDLEILRKKIVDDVTSRLQPEVDRKARNAVNRISDDLRRELDENVEKRLHNVNNQIVVANNQQLAMVQKTTKELVAAVGQQVTNTVYQKVVSEINEKVVPKVQNMVNYVNYQLADGGEIVTDYRRAVDAQANKHLQPGMKMITNGKNNKQVISEHVRLFFGSEDDSDGED